MNKIGLKIWSTNKHYVNEAKRLYDEGFCQYIELMAVPDSYDDVVFLWKNISVPYVIHAPHYSLGLNLAQNKSEAENMRLARQAFAFADMLKADVIIFHPGANGDIEESARQLKKLSDQRIVIENKPKLTTVGDFFCNGYSPNQIEFLMRTAKVGFCLDVAHAICAANAEKIDQISYLKQFLILKPRMFHINDCEWEGVYDRHFHIGQGSFPFEKIIKELPPECIVSVETPHDFQENLKDFERDILALRDIEWQVKTEFELKRAQYSDMLDLFCLANDAFVRKNSFNSRPILLENHQAWFEKKLDDNHTIFYVARNVWKEFIGQVRFDMTVDDQNCYVINISIAAPFRGKGLGKKLIDVAIAQLQKEHGKCIVRAYVKKENESSYKIFTRAGFVLLGKEKVNQHVVFKFEHKIQELI